MREDLLTTGRYKRISVYSLVLWLNELFSRLLGVNKFPVDSNNERERNAVHGLTPRPFFVPVIIL